MVLFTKFSFILLLNNYLMRYQGGLYKKEKKPNLCRIASISMKLKPSMKLYGFVWSFFACVKL